MKKDYLVTVNAWNGSFYLTPELDFEDSLSDKCIWDGAFYDYEAIENEVKEDAKKNDYTYSIEPLNSEAKEIKFYIEKSNNKNDVIVEIASFDNLEVAQAHFDWLKSCDVNANRDRSGKIYTYNLCFDTYDENDDIVDCDTLESFTTENIL